MGARTAPSPTGRPSRAMRSASAPTRSAATADRPPRRRSAIVVGPSSTSAAAASHRSPAWTPSVSPRSVRRLMRRTGPPGRSVCWSTDGGLDDTIRLVRPSTSTDRHLPWRSDVPIDPAERRPLGRTGLTATPLGFGGAPIGGLYRPVADDDAIAVVRRAWDLGIRLFDTAPLYGYGASERRVGAALADRPRDAFVLSTKVGRLVAEVGRIPPGAEIDRQVLDGREDGAYAGTAGRKVLFDFSADGVRRSIDESLERLGLDRIDIALIHDPDDHWAA